MGLKGSPPPPYTHRAVTGPVTGLGAAPDGDNPLLLGACSTQAFGQGFPSHQCGDGVQVGTLQHTVMVRGSRLSALYALAPQRAPMELVRGGHIQDTGTLACRGAVAPKG